MSLLKHTLLQVRAENESILLILSILALNRAVRGNEIEASMMAYRVTLIYITCSMQGSS